ncbi:MAG: trigger factor, partial [Oscillospiraceae bacterium]|nr:trigger factor [Oscillospiraceae bacterium]
MNVQNVKQEKNRLSFDMVIDAEAYEAGLQKAYLKTRGRYNIPGFRKGKASRKMIEMYYGQDVFLSDAIDEIFAENYEKAIEENGWKIVSQPALTNVDVSETKELTLSLAADVYPEVTLGQYKGIEAPKVAAEVSDEEVEQELDRKAKEVARIETVDRPAKEGDTVVIDYEGSVNGVPFDGGKAEGYELTLGSHSFIPGFEEALIGVTANQELPINVTFPTDYHADLAGKDAVFQIKVHEVKETQIPEKDDELAKDVSEFDTLEELRSDIRATILKQKSEGIERAYENAILEKLSQN